MGAGHDDNTRQLFEQRIVQDSDQPLRFFVLQALSIKWPDDKSLKLLQSQLSSFHETYYREQIEEAIKTLREKLGVEG